MIGRLWRRVFPPGFGHFLRVVATAGPRVNLHCLRHLLTCSGEHREINGWVGSRIIFVGCECGRTFWHDPRYISLEPTAAR